MLEKFCRVDALLRSGMYEICWTFSRKLDKSCVPWSTRRSIKMIQRDTITRGGFSRGRARNSLYFRCVSFLYSYASHITGSTVIGKKVILDTFGLEERAVRSDVFTDVTRPATNAFGRYGLDSLDLSYCSRRRRIYRRLLK